LKKTKKEKKENKKIKRKKEKKKKKKKALIKDKRGLGFCCSIFKVSKENEKEIKK
jgi:hypothetical protein